MRILYVRKNDFMLPFTDAEAVILTTLRLRGPSTLHALYSASTYDEQEVRVALRSLVRWGMVSKSDGLFKLED